MKLIKSFVPITAVWDYFTKWCLYAVVFLVPLLFLPLTLYPESLNRQFVITSLVLLAFIAWLIKAITRGELAYAKSPINIVIFILIIFTAISVWFSESRSVGFMGVNGGEVDTLINIVSLGLFSFLLPATFKSKKEIVQILNCLLISSSLVLAFSFLQLLNLTIFPWEFTKESTFNTIGTTNALGIYLGFILAVVMVLLYHRISLPNTITKILLAVFAAVLFIVVFLIGYWPVFIGLILTILVLIIINLSSGKSKGIAGNNLPLLSILMALIFVLLINFGFIRLKLPVFNLPAEVTPSFQASWSIAKNTIKEGAKNFILGSGPATFAYQYSLYKDTSLNNTPFWNSQFSQGYNALLTHLVNWGFIGTIIFKIILLFSLLLIFKLFTKKHSIGESDSWGIEIGLLYLILLLFFYPQNYVLYFSLFLFLGLLIAKDSLIENRYQLITLTGSPQKTFVFSLGTMLLIMLSTSLLYINGQRYIGAVYFAHGVKVANETVDVDRALPYLLSGLDLDPKNDFYLKTLSSVFLVRINDVLKKADLSPTDLQAQFSGNIGSALQMARRSTEVNQNNSSNWLTLAKTYESVIPLVSGAAEEAFRAYKRAIELEPNNPEIFSGLGRAHLSFADRLTEEKETKEKISAEYSLAIVNFDKALVLKPDFAPAHFSLVQVFDRQNKTEEAIARAERLRAVVLSDNNSDNDVGILFQLGLLHYQAGRFNESKDLFEDVIQLTPDYSNALYFLGLIYDKQNNKKEALELFSRIAKLNSDNEEIKNIIINLENGRSALSGIFDGDIQDKKEAPIEEKRSQ